MQPTMDLEKLLKTVTAKFSLLEVTWQSAEKSLQDENQRDCERGQKTSESKISEIYELKSRIQEEKLLAGESMDTVQKWGCEIDEKINKYEKHFQEVSNFLKAKAQEVEDERLALGRENRESEYTGIGCYEKITSVWKQKGTVAHDSG